jgi:hypothetical protein
MRRSTAVSERDGTIDLDAGMRICTPTMEELPSVLPGVDEPMFLGQEEGRVRYLWICEVPASRKRGHRGSRSTPFRPPSLQIKN